MRLVTHKHRPAFTLIELLMVIAIIGVLVGVTVPAVLYAMRKATASALAIEVQSLGQAVEAYKNKNGDYPPDGSNVAVFERHFRKRFPNMLASEFTTLYGPADSSGSVLVANSTLATPPAHVMDPPEALVFCLGGFSTDPTKPFTGSGGPLFNSGTAASPVWQYNPDRNPGEYEFKQARLTLVVDGSGLTRSNDEAVFGGTADCLPCYLPSSRQAPFVYFDSRTYSFATPAGTFYNYYAPGPATSPALGVARPYRSGNINTKVGAVSAANADAYYRYMNERSFQIICAGLDDNYGNVPFTSGSGPRFYAYPSGESIDFVTAVPTVGAFSRYLDYADDPNKYQLDNSANFSEGTLADTLPN